MIVHAFTDDTSQRAPGLMLPSFISIVLGSMLLFFSGLIITDCMEGRNTPVQLQNKVLALQRLLNERMFVSGSVGFGAERI